MTHIPVPPVVRYSRWRLRLYAERDELIAAGKLREAQIFTRKYRLGPLPQRKAA